MRSVAAAATGGLAAFGPGGMVVGMTMVIGLVGTGPATTAAAPASGRGTAGATPNLDKLTMRLAAEYIRKLLDRGFDTGLWYQIAGFESQVSAAISRLEPFNHANAVRPKQLSVANAAVNAGCGSRCQSGWRPPR